MKPARLFAAALLAGTVIAALPAPTPAQGKPQQQEKPVYTPVATSDHRVGSFHLALRRDTQTLARLSPASEPGFSFVPTARLPERAGNGYNHLGDLNLRLRQAGGEWRDFASAQTRKPIRALATGGDVIAAADISASMGDGIPLAVERRWLNEGGSPALVFRLTNRSTQPVEIGALGMPMVFDNILTGRSLEEAHAQASFVDPYIGRDAGYLQVTRLNGHGPALLVLPRPGTPLEAYSPLKNPKEAAGSLFTDKSPRGQTSEGFYDWMVHSAGMAEREWQQAGEQWNRPTSRTLAPGEVMEVGVRLVEAPSIRAIEDVLAAQGRPVAVGIPGYVLPTDQRGTLFVKAPSPIKTVESEPEGALLASRDGEVNGWTRLSLQAKGWGQVRLTLTYEDGQKQTISYFLTKPLAQVMADLGRFSTRQQWYEGKGDPFGRSPAILTYDKEAGKIVDVEPRVWIAGMSDEGGGGSWVAATLKQLDNPDPAEVARIEQLVNETVLGDLQVADGPQAGAVKKSLFYYDPARFPDLYKNPEQWRSWTSWDKKGAGDLGRSFNYPHVALGHWVLYRTARNHPGMVKQHDAAFYLRWAWRTIVAMMRDAPHYAEFGQVEGDVFVDILRDLRREGMAEEAATLERLMKGRADHWKSLKYPFGSEMPWDSTGQPEVYAWMRYFGHAQQADTTREVILGYDPTLPSWGYNGNARRYWDFLYGGKYARVERQIHHYGSTLNAVPLFDAYRRDPADFHLLRVAYGGLLGGITNIDQDGFSSAAFHAWPDMMKWDPYSGDYGMGFFGHAYATASYLVNHPTFGWLGFGGDVSQSGEEIIITPKDSARSRLYIAPAGQWITLEAGKIARATYNPASGQISLTLDPATPHTPVARLYLEAMTPAAKRLTVPGAVLEREGYSIPLDQTPLTLRLTAP